MSDIDIHRLTGAYALGALDEDEAAFFARHLEDCEACRAEVAEFRETAAVLASATATQPPPAMRGRVLGEVSRTRQVAPAVEGGQGWVERRLTPVAAALAILVVSLGGVAAYLASELADRNDQDQMMVFLEELLEAPDARAVTLEAAEGHSGTATFFHTEVEDRGQLVVSGLDPLPEGQVVQLWLFHDGEPVPAATATVGEDGTARIIQTGWVAGAEMAAVTAEPEGGSPQPTGPVLLAGELP